MIYNAMKGRRDVTWQICTSLNSGAENFALYGDSSKWTFHYLPNDLT